MSMIIILIGEMGAGKNYYGERLSRDLDIPFLDGDTVCTPAMVERVSKFKPLSPELIDDYIENHLSKAILERAEEGHLIVGQALYRNNNRLRLMRILEEHGHPVRFVYIDTPFFQNLKQCLSRPKGIRWALYWLLNKPFFQKPTHSYEVI